MKRAWLLICLSFSTLAARATVDNSQAVTAIVGEAAGESYSVKLAVAAAIRNRNSLRGVYGLNAAHNASEPAWVWRDARRAWTESAMTDPTHGANHFGNADDVRKGTFEGMKLTLVLGSGRTATYFFKA